MVTQRHSLQVQSMLGQCLHLSPQGRRIDDHMLFVYVLEVLLLLYTASALTQSLV